MIDCCFGEKCYFFLPPHDTFKTAVLARQYEFCVHSSGEVRLFAQRTDPLRQRAENGKDELQSMEFCGEVQSISVTRVVPLYEIF
jgi:hypothetical protein